MKVETCKMCSCKFGSSLDDAAFGDAGETTGLCEQCQSELAVVEVLQNDI